MSDDPWLATAKTLPAGRRTRIECCSNDKSMLVSNEAKGFRAYCFRCGPRGFVAHGDFTIDQLRRRRDELALLQEATVRLPTDFTTTIPPTEAVWLYKAGVSAALAQHYGFGYSEALRRVILPVYENGELAGFTARSTINAKPKYIERMARPSDTIFASDPAVALPSTEARSGDPRPDVVLTEDILSAVRVGRHVRKAVALLGTSANAAQLLRATEAARTVAVWLDPDRPGKRAATSVVRSLQLYGLQVRRITTARDPKYYSNREIRSILGD